MYDFKISTIKLKISTQDIHIVFYYLEIVCRNLKPLFNFDPPATEEEIYNASIQFVRKISGFTKPSKANLEAFDKSVNDVKNIAEKLLNSLVTNVPPKNREIEAQKVRKKFEKNLENLRNQ